MESRSRVIPWRTVKCVLDVRVFYLLSLDTCCCWKYTGNMFRCSRKALSVWNSYVTLRNVYVSERVRKTDRRVGTRKKNQSTQLFWRVMNFYDGRHALKTNHRVNNIVPALPTRDVRIISYVLCTLIIRIVS